MGALVKLDVQGNLVERFIDGYKSSSTKRNYLEAIMDFAETMKIRNTWEITIDTIQTVSLIQAQNYIKAILKEGKYGKAKVARSALKTFWQEVIDTYEIEIANVWDNKTISNTMKRMMPKSTGLPKGQVLSTEQIKEILDSIEDTRDRLLIKVMLNTGCRREGIASMRWNKFRQIEDKWFATVVEKGDKEREVYVNDEVIKSIQEWKPNMVLGGDDDCRLFWLSGNRINELVKKYCGQKITAHQLRHTAATHMARAKASSVQLKDQFGWESIVTADKYIHYVDKYTNPAGALISF